MGCGLKCSTEGVGEGICIVVGATWGTTLDCRRSGRHGEGVGKGMCFITGSMLELGVVEGLERDVERRGMSEGSLSTEIMGGEVGSVESVWRRYVSGEWLET